MKTLRSIWRALPRPIKLLISPAVGVVLMVVLFFFCAYGLFSALADHFLGEEP